MNKWRCRKHPHYDGKQEPKNECGGCWSYYWLGRQKNLFEEEKECIKQENN